MARSRLVAIALCLLAATALGPVALAPAALADGGAGNSLGSLRSIGSTSDLNRPVSGPASGRIGGIAVDPSDPSGARHFNGVPSRIAQGDTSAASDPSGNTVYVGAANGGVWKTTNGGNAAGNPGAGFLRSMDGGKTWSTAPTGGHNTGALQNVDGSNTWSKPATPFGSHNTGALRNVSNSNTAPPTGPAALRAKTN